MADAAEYVAGTLWPLAASLRHPGQHVTQADHALRCAQIAADNDADDDLTVAAFVHDLAKPVDEIRHGEVMAVLMLRRLGLQLSRLLAVHGRYVAQLNHGEAPHAVPGDGPRLATLALRFAAWDAAALEPGDMADPAEMLELLRSG